MYGTMSQTYELLKVRIFINMDSEDGDSNTELCIYLFYKAYLRMILKMRKYAFVCFKRVLI